MEIKNQKTLGKKSYIILNLTLIMVLFIFIWLNSFLKESNRKYKNYAIDNLNSISPPFIHSNIKTSYLAAESNNFYFKEPYDESIDIILKVMEAVPELDDEVTEHKVFNSIFDLSSYCLLTQNYRAENNLINFYVNNSFSIKDEFTDFLDYLEENYLSPAFCALENQQFENAKWLSHRAFLLLLKVDTDPLYMELDYTSKKRANKILLIDILLSDLVDVYTFSDKLINLIPRVEAHLNISMDQIRELNFSGNLLQYKQYWEGIYKFRNKNYAEAAVIFHHVFYSSKNQTLKELCNLMQVRCIVWDCINKNYKNSNTAIENLRKLMQNIKNKNLKTDVDYYIDFLKNPTKYNNTDIKDKEQLIKQLEEILNELKNDL